MANINDLIEVKFEDAVLHTVSDTSDILGVLMPYHWGPAGKVNVFDQVSFYTAYPEDGPSLGEDAPDYSAYAQVKAYFANGGSRVAVFRPAAQCTSLLSISDVNTMYTKYPGSPYGVSLAASITGTSASTDRVLDIYDSTGRFIATGLTIYTSSDGTATGTMTEVTLLTDVKPHVSYFKAGSEASTYVAAVLGIDYSYGTLLETYRGQTTDPAGVDEDGETTYILDMIGTKSQYAGFEPGTDTTSITLVQAFATSDSLIPTQFLEYSEGLDHYNTSVAFVPSVAEASRLHKKFLLYIDGTEKIWCLNQYRTINCNAGVAGAYARIAAQVNLNQVASAKAYGSYNGILTASKSFSEVLADANAGVISVYNSTSGPQIFGVRNSYAAIKPASYFSKANVSRVLASVLKNVLPDCISAVHTATAADEILRAQFQANLNSILGQYAGRHELGAESNAVCSSQSGGQVLQIILNLYFIGLVEKISIKVVATDSSVTVTL